MKIFTSKNFTRKFIISVVCVILLNFCLAPTVKAETLGGKMMGTIRDFVTAIADVTASIIQFGVTGEWRYAVDEKGTGEPSGSDYWVKKRNFYYPILQVSPELIFANEIQLLDANFLTSADNDRDYVLGLTDDSALETLREVIAGWYVTFRTLATVGLLSVLIYIGIRIMISSTSADKAKYKERMMDWVVAFCLLFFMHYIMAAALTVVDKVNEMLGEATGIYEGIEINPDYGTVKYDPDSTENDDNESISQATARKFWNEVKYKCNGGSY